MVMSNWHKCWTNTSDQLHDLCRSLHLIRGEVEGNLFESRSRRSHRPLENIDMVVSRIAWVLHQIESELPPARAAGPVEASLCVHKQCRGRTSSSDCQTD